MKPAWVVGSVVFRIEPNVRLVGFQSVHWELGNIGGRRLKVNPHWWHLNTIGELKCAEYLADQRPVKRLARWIISQSCAAPCAGTRECGSPGRWTVTRRLVLTGI